jgi:hypothetical protein
MKRNPQVAVSVNQLGGKPDGFAVLRDGLGHFATRGQRASVIVMEQGVLRRHGDPFLQVLDRLTHFLLFEQQRPQAVERRIVIRVHLQSLAIERNRFSISPKSKFV